MTKKDKTTNVYNGIGISEKQLSDLTRALLTSDFVDVIHDAVNNSNDNSDDIFWDRKSEFYATIQGKLENALFQCDIIK